MNKQTYNKRLMSNMSVNGQNHLVIDGVDTVDIVNKYGTPVNVYDISLIKQKISAFKEAFKNYENKTQVAYASKAFSSLALYEMLAKEDVSLDVVSGGELFLALKAGFPKERIHFHGNNKSYEELEAAISEQIGCIVIDNFYEIGMIKELTDKCDTKVDVLIRVTPGVEAHTHEYITTGQADSKFGFDLTSGQVETAIKQIKSIERINMIGLHAHIGSQIFEVDGYQVVIEKLISKAKEWKNAYNFDLDVLNVGGGFGIRYTDEDAPLPLEEYAKAIMSAVRKHAELNDMELPEIWIEPGRSIVGEAGTSLYTIGTQKTIPSIRKYVSVDGGMADNIRPALYQAEYTGVLANRVNEEEEEKVSIAGKACESGDMLIWDITLPQPDQNDILAVFSTGAYGYSMASNYNRLPRPAVVFVENGKDFLAIRRETVQDYLKLENSIENWK
ncbi:diaminopimelate decarboxylase [Alkalibacterium subtropicum]|uniref:Diaminopimelate decarboxylase n=2 Tax=Alkalibacterium subtropicum TaxID=753702 RepID=A0A1I1ELX9_9LACT|nr:diaminopimelate decarboxylase [Alkalibacterium subtropicum]SFB88085.1 diaminopimelate decarboxylase [Alkalibacterium subtropicum]